MFQGWVAANQDSPSNPFCLLPLPKETLVEKRDGLDKAAESLLAPAASSLLLSFPRAQTYMWNKHELWGIAILILHSRETKLGTDTSSGTSRGPVHEKFNCAGHGQKA